MRLKVWVIALIIFSLSVPIALAVSSPDEKTMKKAQKYGIESISKPMAEFLKPWLAVEDQAKVFDEHTDHAYFYTPFLLIASDARERSLQKKPVEISASQAVINLYAGYLVFNAIICGDEPKFAEEATAILRQEKSTINVSQAIIGQPQKYFGVSNKPSEPRYKSNCYFYFSEEKISLKKPVLLIVKLKNNQERQFYFNLAKLQ